MTEELFNEIKNIQSQIENKKREIRIIDQLMESPTISCKIENSGGKFRSPSTYYISGDKIKVILNIEKQLIEKDIIELEEKFGSY